MAQHKPSKGSLDRRIRKHGTPSVSNSNTDKSKVSLFSKSLGNKDTTTSHILHKVPKGKQGSGNSDGELKAAIERRLSKK